MPVRRIVSSFGVLAVEVVPVGEGFVALVAGGADLPFVPMPKGDVSPTEDEAVRQLARAVERLPRPRIRSERS